MLIIRFLRFIAGYCKVEVRGLFPERFLNLCMVHGIRLWNVERAEQFCLRLFVRRSSAKRLDRLALQSGNEVKILSRHGVTDILYRYRKRYALLLGFFVFALLIYYMSAFVWSIEVSGNEKISDGTILSKLNELGVSEGTPRSKLDFRAIANDMLLQIPELAWISVNDYGSKLSVEVKERKEKPNISNKSGPCDVVAKKTGYILSMEVYEGEKVAKINTAVQKGELIVSGSVALLDEKVRLVTASAKIMASVDYRLEYSCKPFLIEKEFTGKAKKRWALSIMKTGFNLFFNSRIEYQKYDKMLNKYDFKIGEDFYLPIALHCMEYREYEEVKIPITKEMQQNLCKRSVDDAAEKLTGSNEVKNTKYKEKWAADGSLTMTLTFQCVEDIAEQKALQIA